MLNVILDAKNQSFKLCTVDGIDVVSVPGFSPNFLSLTKFPKQHKYHAKIDNQIDTTLSEMHQGLIAKLMSVLEASLSKLSRYDEGSLIGSILSFTVSILIRNIYQSLF
jgi:calcium-dependent secretion activator